MKMTECENLISFIGLSQQKIKDKVAYMTEIYCLEARRPNQGCEQDWFLLRITKEGSVPGLYSI